MNSSATLFPQPGAYGPSMMNAPLEASTNSPQLSYQFPHSSTRSSSFTQGTDLMDPSSGNDSDTNSTSHHQRTLLPETVYHTIEWRRNTAPYSSIAQVASPNVSFGSDAAITPARPFDMDFQAPSCPQTSTWPYHSVIPPPCTPSNNCPLTPTTSASFQNNSLPHSYYQDCQEPPASVNSRAVFSEGRFLDEAYPIENEVGEMFHHGARFAPFHQDQSQGDQSTQPTPATSSSLPATPQSEIEGQNEDDSPQRCSKCNNAVHKPAQRRRATARSREQTRTPLSPKNAFLVKSKAAGMSYREIREQGHFTEAESTLRGRFRNLTKDKSRRVRRPLWIAKDVRSR